MKELEITEGESVRAFFMAQMDSLREEIAGLRVENTGLRDEVREMRGENTMLRKEVRDLHGTIDGMRREALQAGVSTQRAVVDALPPGFVPPATQEALDRMKGVGE
jgi:regulator of replication initiation timing